MTRPESFPQLGIMFPASEQSMPLVDFARAAEDRGFDSILLPEHTHMPVSHTPYPGGEPLPPLYKGMIDPYIGLAAVAATTNLKLATCISLVAQHDPVALAKAIATLDFLSDGRFTLGVGYGWNREELANHGHEFKDRRAIVRESVALMRALWTDTEAEYHGQHFNLEPSWMWPKPVQQPSVPVLLGRFASDAAYTDIASWADGWIPYGPPDVVAGWLKALRAKWDEAGRSEKGPIVWPMMGVVDDDQLRANLASYHRLGVAQVVLDFQSASRDETMPLLDRYAKVLASSFN